MARFERHSPERHERDSTESSGPLETNVPVGCGSPKAWPEKTIHARASLPLVGVALRFREARPKSALLCRSDARV